MFDKLRETLGTLLEELTPAPWPPQEDLPPKESLYLDGTEPDDRRWRELVTRYLPTASSFAIHCWEDETEAIDLALGYGRKVPFDWAHGVVIQGPVTPAFRAFLLGLPRPQDRDIYNKMTPFFGLELDNGFTSAHYGTEIHWPAEP